MKKFSLCRIGFMTAITVLVCSGLYGQIKPIPIGELTDSMRSNPKPALILISTSWCTYCQMQKNQLKKNTDFQSASAFVYFSELDAETEEDIIFNDTIYRYNSTGVATGSHELAYALGNLDNRLAFPTWVLINENFEIILKYPSILKPDEVSKLLNTMQQEATVQ